MTRNNTAQTGVRFISRDEMNLAEFPLTVLSTRANPSKKTLEFNDTIYGRDGKPIQRSWIITGADKFGLPTSSDDEILLGLLKLTVDQGFNDRKIYFTRYELLRALRWSTEGRNYQRLQNALDRLTGVRIKATNAFFDNESKAHSTRNFGILDAYEINDGRDVQPRPSFFIWSEVLFKSFQVGFIKKLDLDFYLDLSSAVTRRLYRYLDKHFWYKSRVSMNLFTLAHEKIGVSRNYRYPSSIRQQLDPAVEELVEKGFLADCQYSGKGKASEVTFFAQKGAPRSVESKRGTAEVIPFRGRTDGEAPREKSQYTGTRSSAGVSGVDEFDLVSELVDRGLQRRQAEKFADSADPKRHERYQAIISYYDSLVSQGSHLIRRSPVGFLYRAIERADSFVLPGEEAQGSLEFGKVKTASGARNVRTSDSKRSEERSNLMEDDDALRARYLVFRKAELDKLKAEAEPRVLEELLEEQKEALSCMRKYISAERFEETVAHGVEQRLAKLFAVPDFDEWSKTN